MILSPQNIEKITFALRESKMATSDHRKSGAAPREDTPAHACAFERATAE